MGVTGYRVERCKGAGCTSFAQLAKPSGTSYNNAALATNNSYSYRVRAVDAAGYFSAYSNIATATTPLTDGIIKPPRPFPFSLSFFLDRPCG